jgi:hypothetical protein
MHLCSEETDGQMVEILFGSFLDYDCIMYSSDEIKLVINDLKYVLVYALHCVYSRVKNNGD